MSLGHRTIGHGPNKVLVLHGWFGDHEIWAPTFDFLDTELFTYVFPDFRGYGMSRGLSGDFTIPEMGTDAIEVADSLRWSRFFLVGHSMGGKVAQWIAGHAPDRVLAVVGVTPVPVSGVRIPDELLPNFRAAGNDIQSAFAVVDGSMGNRLTPAIPIAVVRHQRRTTNNAAFEKYFEAFSATDYSNETRALISPFLVLVGEHDRGVSEQLVRESFPVRFPHVHVEVLPNSGHYPMLETPAWLVTSIEGFLHREISEYSQP